MNNHLVVLVFTGYCLTWTGLSCGADTTSQFLQQLAQAEASMREGSHEKAITLYEDALKEVDPQIDASGFLVNLATCYKLSGDFDQAAQTYLRAINANDKNWPAQEGYGRLLTAQGKYGKALGVFNGLDRAQKAGSVAELAAWIAWIEGRGELAAHFFQEAFRANPHLPWLKEALIVLNIRKPDDSALIEVSIEDKALFIGFEKLQSLPTLDENSGLLVRQYVDKLASAIPRHLIALQNGTVYELLLKKALIKNYDATIEAVKSIGNPALQKALDSARRGIKHP
jgi:tetratricopeptide (TPR) repeat protein